MAISSSTSVAGIIAPTVSRNTAMSLVEFVRAVGPFGCYTQPSAFAGGCSTGELVPIAGATPPISIVTSVTVQDAASTCVAFVWQVWDRLA